MGEANDAVYSMTVYHLDRLISRMKILENNDTNKNYDMFILNIWIANGTTKATGRWRKRWFKGHLTKIHKFKYITD